MTCQVFSTALTVILLTAWCSGQATGRTSPEEAVPLLTEVLRTAGLSGSLEFSGDCEDIGHAWDFPKLHSPTIGEPPLQALREIFSADPKMQITQDSSGIVRMVEIDIPHDLIDIRLNHLEFHRSQSPSVPLYDPEIALSKILSAPEMKDFSAAHDIAPPYTKALNSHSVSPESPHTLETLEGLTVSQALDHLLLTFPGIWVYKDCPTTVARKRRFEFSFYRNNPGRIEHPK